jgi:chemotaxis protein methyltransferase CheR
MDNERRPKEFEFTDADFAFIARLVYKESGIVLAGHKRDMVYSRLSRRLRSLNLHNFKSYCNYVEKHEAEEMMHLVNAITTNLTSFFRENHHFEFLRDTVLPTLAKTNKDKKIRIWSAGCSQGSEPYSIAMVLADFLDKNKGFDAKILATDIDTNMLDRARSGAYRMEDLKSIPSVYHKYTSQKKREGEQGIMMADSIRQLITFNQLNLLDKHWPMKGLFDVIFCRNVVIYFDKETQRPLFDHYASQMKPQSWLFIGHSESLFKVSDKFELIGKTIYKKAAK